MIQLLYPAKIKNCKFYKNGLCIFMDNHGYCYCAHGEIIGFLCVSMILFAQILIVNLDTQKMVFIIKTIIISRFYK